MSKKIVDLRVLLVGMGHYPLLPDADSDACVGSFVNWFRLLFNHVGLRPSNIWAVGTAPSEFPKGPMTADLRSENREICQGLVRGRGRQGEGTGETSAVLDLIDRFVASLPTDRKTHALVVWAGHGWAAPDGGLHLATASTRWTGQSLFGGGGSTLTDTVPWDELTARLAKRPRKADLTVVLDTCFAGAGLRGSRGPKLDDGVVLMASQGAEQAREIHLHGQAIGAFSWAVTAVLSRWATELGQGVSITPEQLIARAAALLFGMGIEQLPAFDGPLAALRQPLLTRSGRGGKAPPELPGIEINPDDFGRVYDVTYGTTLMTRRMVATTPTASFGVTPSKRLWLYEPIVGETFNIKPSTDQSAPTSSATGCFQDEGWSPTPVTSLPTNPTGKGWKITKTTGGTVVGWMYIDSNEGLVFVCKGTNPSFFPTEITFTWQTTLQIDSQSSYYIAQCPKVTS